MREIALVAVGVIAGGFIGVTFMCLFQINKDRHYRYSSMALMCVPLLVWEFGFQSVADMILYFMCDTVLLVAYLIIWRFYFIRPTLKIALCLAILPTLIFLISGVLLRHWLLVVAAVLFGIGHIYITVQNHK